MAGVAFFNQARSPLAVAVGSTDLTIQLVSGGAWAAATGPFTVMIENEAIRCSSINGNVLTIASNGRGFDQTSPQAHALTDSLGNPTMVVGAIVRRDFQDAFVRLDTAAAQVLTGPLSVPPAIGSSAPSTLYGTLPVKIDDILVGTDSRYPGATAQITFLNTSGVGTNLLPTGFRHLLVEWYARGDAAAGSVTLAMRLNNISTPLYEYEYQQTVGTATQVPVEGLTQTSMWMGLIPAATATANYFGSGETKLKHYNGAVGQKVIFSDCALITGDTGSNTQRFVSTAKWRTTATPVTRVDLILSSGSIIIGSLFTLWGIP